MTVTIAINVYPADDGMFSCLTRDIETDNTPRIGDSIEVADGWCSSNVKVVIWDYNLSSVEIRLEPLRGIEEPDRVKLFEAFGKDPADRSQYPQNTSLTPKKA